MWQSGGISDNLDESVTIWRNMWQSEGISSNLKESVEESVAI